MPAWVNASVQQPFVLHMHVVHASQTAIVGKNFTETIDADPAPGRRRYAHPRVSLGWPSTNRRPTERMPEWRGCNASPQPWETCGDCPPHTVSMGGRAHIARVTSVVVPVARLSQPLSMLHARPPSVDASNVSEVVDILRNGRRFWGGEGSTLPGRANATRFPKRRLQMAPCARPCARVWWWGFVRAQVFATRNC